MKVSKLVKCVFPIHPRTRSNLSKFGLYDKYRSIDSLIITEPLGYVDFMCLQKNSKLIITDSGGVQEESSFFNVPCLTLRENTERPITIKEGTNLLIGTNYAEIYNYVKNIDYNIKSNIKLWDGCSSNRIVQILKQVLY